MRGRRSLDLTLDKKDPRGAGRGEVCGGRSTGALEGCDGGKMAGLFVKTSPGVEDAKIQVLSVWIYLFYIT